MPAIVVIRSGCDAVMMFNSTSTCHLETWTVSGALPVPLFHGEYVEC